MMWLIKLSCENTWCVVIGWFDVFVLYENRQTFSPKTCQLSFCHFIQFKTDKRWWMKEYDQINLCTARQKDGSKTIRRNVYPKIVPKQGQKMLLSFNLSRLLLLKGLWYFYEWILRTRTRRPFIMINFFSIFMSLS